MRFGAFGLVLSLAAAGCGSYNSPTPAAAFALDAGNYTLKISGTGTCGVGGAGSLEGTAPVTVTRSGTAYTVRSQQTSDTFAMSFTTDGATTGSVQGSISGALSGASSVTINATGTLTGNNSSANTAGGPITPLTGGPGGVSFSSPGGSGTCISATWTLTPR